VNLPARNYIDVLEAGSDADKKKNKKEPGFCAEPAIKCQAKEYTDANCQNYRDADAGKRRQIAIHTYLVTFHVVSVVSMRGCVPTSSGDIENLIGYAISLKHLPAARMVASMSAVLCAAETKAVSNWDGAR